MSRTSSFGSNPRRTNCRGQQRRRPTLKTLRLLRHQEIAESRLKAEQVRRKEKRDFCAGLAKAAEDAEKHTAPPPYKKPLSWWRGYLLRFNFGRKQPA
jgi:hypothetical protein